VSIGIHRVHVAALMGAVLLYLNCGGSKGVGDGGPGLVVHSNSDLLRKRLDVPTKFGRVNEEGMAARSYILPYLKHIAEASLLP
jgi:hypothetical protein